ncbi:alpha/beta fold hydrolase [Streptomyces hazeniae]|uniref:alpha/beta fold hydrolase n=1 Tax=Streptomyces hazeniae TaxID=3075538 RepID=UPI00288B5C9D|nr:hypothetical protein [Streptomyces sp. DSM 42041]
MRLTPHVPPGEPHPVWWKAGLEAALPLVVVVGGPRGGLPSLLTRLAGRGYAVVASELPGVAPGTRPYAADSWRLLPELIDRYATSAPRSGVHVVGFGLGGHLALRAAAAEQRIGTVHTVGAPVSGLFTDLTRLLTLPVGATDVLARATGASGRDMLRRRLAGLAVTPEELRSVAATVRVGVVTDDPLVPPQDLALLDLLLDRAVFQKLRGSGSGPAARPLRRWLSAGLPRSRTRAATAPR